MPIREIVRDVEALTMTAVCEFAVPPARVWQLWADPRQLERWWGPPDWPATFVEHDFTVGGRAFYAMHGPDGDTAHARWRFLAITEPSGLEIEEGFAHADGSDDDSMPVSRLTVTIEAGEVTIMTVTWHFTSLEVIEQFDAMGMDEGLRSALAQIDGLLAG